MPLIRDTIDPLNEREVSDQEATDLEKYGILLTGTRAKTPDGLRAAAVRQVTERLEGAVMSAPPAPTAVIGVGEPVNDEDKAVDDGPQTPGDAPENAPDTPDSQES